MSSHQKGIKMNSFELSKIAGFVGVLSGITSVGVGGHLATRFGKPC